MELHKDSGALRVIIDVSFTSADEFIDFIENEQCQNVQLNSEYEIRDALHPEFLYSSAFIIILDSDENQIIKSGKEISLVKELITLLDKIIDLGNADETLIEEFPFWFSTYRREGSTHNGKWKVYKYAKQEINKQEFSKMIVEIPKLSEHINHPYVNDITIFIEDLRMVKEELTENLSNLVLWVNGRCHKVMNPIVHPSSVTRSAVKVSLKEVVSIERRVTTANIANVPNEVRQEVFQELLNNGTISYEPLIELIESSRIGTRFCFTDDNGWRVSGRRGIEGIQHVNIPIRERNDIDTILKVDKIFRLRRENDEVVGIDTDNPYGFSVSLVEVE